MIITVLIWGAVAGLVHFVVIGILYGNPLTDRISAGARSGKSGRKKMAVTSQVLCNSIFRDSG